MTVVRFMNNRISSQIGRGERRLSIAPGLSESAEKHIEEGYVIRCNGLTDVLQSRSD